MEISQRINSIINLTLNKVSWEEGLFSYYLAFLSMILMPLYPYYMPPLMIGWGICVLIEFIVLKEKPYKRNAQAKYLLILFVAYFILLGSGLLYSTELDNAKLLLFRRLSLMIFPFILFSPGHKIIEKKWLLLRTFALSTFAYLIICYLYAFYRSSSIVNGHIAFSFRTPADNWISYFLGSDFTIFQHPSYVAMDVVLSIFVAFESFLDKSLKSTSHYLWLSFGFFFLISIYFLSSRAAYLTILILVPLYVISKFWRKKTNIILLVILFAGLAALIYFFNSNQRVQILLNGSKNSTIQQKVTSDLRLSIWRSSLEVIKKNPVIGVGLGDSSTELQKEFRELGYTKGYYDNLNSHNQFLEAGLSSGIPGILILVLIVGYMIYISFSTRNLLYLLFTLMMIVFFTFESVLNRMAGSYFFSIFSFLLIILSFNSKGE